MKKRKSKNKQKKEPKLVTLQKYLHNEISKGPRESIGKINYHYQDYENIYNYFMILITELKDIKILCIPNVVLRYSNYVSRTAIGFNYQNNKIYLPKNVKVSIRKCQKKAKTRFIFFTFMVIPDDRSTLTHANMLIIDLKQKTVERFEPYGSTIGGPDGKKIGYKIDRRMPNVINDLLGLKKFKYIPPNKLSPKLGVQSKADAHNGMCITISMMYLHLRILNPDIKSNKLVKYLLKMSKSKLKKMILQYAKKVETVLKKHSDFVLELTDNMFEDF